MSTNTSDYVYTVHTVQPEEISAIAFVTFSLEKAEEYAATVSNDPGVLAGAVTRLVVDAAGFRTAVALYVGGVRQQVPYVSDDRRIAANGHGTASKYVPH
jgi:hypothetical protein